MPEEFNALEVPLLDGVTLVEASAGTGKTFAITRLVLRLLLERRVESLSQILVVTFTDKATQELVTRIRSVLRLADRVWSETPPKRTASIDDLFVLREKHYDGRAIISAALGSLDDLGVSTIHGFCQRMLAESALETRMPFRTTFVEDETEPLQRAALDWLRQRTLVDSKAAEQLVSQQADIDQMVDKFVRTYRRQAGTTLHFDPYIPHQATVADFVHTVDIAFNREKSRRHLLGFDDLLRILCNVLTEEGPQGALAQRIRSRYRAALIDEFQDTDNTQFPIFSNAFAGCPLFLIGDPKQSIYAFRGADIHAYLRAADAAGRRYTLVRNFRSTPAYVGALEQLFTRAPEPFRYDESRIDYPRVTAATSPAAPGGTGTDGCGAMVWWWVDKALGPKGDFVAKDLALTLLVDAIRHEIVRLLGEGLQTRSIAVLLRTNNQAREVKAALDAAGVPSVIAGAEDVLASDEAFELVRIADAIASPYDHRAVSSALATRIWGSDAAAIANAVADGGETEWGRITDRFAELRDAWRQRGVSAALGAVLAERRTAERLLSLPDGERRLTNVRHVIELLHTAAADDGVILESVGSWHARERTVSNTPERRQQRLETDSEAVQILTIHKAKGLEFDVVFCPTLWDERKPMPGPFGITAAAARTAGDCFVLDIGSPEHADRLTAFQLEEDAEAQRLAYVALTRAVHRCYVAIG
ncbi:MAG TPA: UvrD-helicase domain-containing protein, partial [Gemmatimonadaceae bacterium]|nr:UvrD-helicase domain-containing protein [Gemmatimonadaceae bacterium]